MKPIALVTTKPGFEPQLKDELNKLPINKKIFGYYNNIEYSDFNWVNQFQIV